VLAKLLVSAKSFFLFFITAFTPLVVIKFETDFKLSPEAWGVISTFFTALAAFIARHYERQQVVKEVAERAKNDLLIEQQAIRNQRAELAKQKEEI